MKMNSGNRGYWLGARLAIVASLLGSVGCGSADFESEPVGQSAEAVTVTIGDWNALVAMGTTGTYALSANINASGRTWTPKDFSGIFDGNGNTISNLTINVQGDAGFFKFLTGATVRNVKFTGLRVTGFEAGGLAAYVYDSTLERIVVEGTITSNGWHVGGIAGYMYGGTLSRSYAKGTVNGSPSYAAGGLVGGVYLGSDDRRGEIYESYAQVTVAPNTSDPTRRIYAGGIVGSTYAGRIHDVYHVGNVTGRGGVGGLVGYISGESDNPFMLYNSISRGGDVQDKNKSGWEGTVGVVSGVNNRFSLLFFDAQADPTPAGPNTSYNAPESQHGHSTNELRLPPTPSGGVFCVGGGDCGDGKFSDPPWFAGSATEHHTLRGMPGPNIQPL